MTKVSDADRWELRNLETGEVGRLNAFQIRPYRGRHPYYRAGRFAWYMVSGDEYGLVVRTLRGAELHVFAALPLLMRRDNFLACSQREIGEATGLSVSAISRALKRLRKELIIGEVDGVLTFSPEIAWKGDVVALGKALERWREAKIEWLRLRKGRCRPEG